MNYHIIPTTSGKYSILRGEPPYFYLNSERILEDNRQGRILPKYRALEKLPRSIYQHAEFEHVFNHAKALNQYT